MALIPALAVAVLVSGCGGDGERTYSATPFGDCLQDRGANPGAIEPGSGTTERVVGALREEANRQLGSLEAFSGTEVFPEAGETNFLFFDDNDQAKGAAGRIGRAEQQQAQKTRITEKKPPEVRGNLVIDWPTQGPTRGQEETINACLKEAEAEE